MDHIISWRGSSNPGGMLNGRPPNRVTIHRSATHVAVIFTGEPVFAAVFARVIQREVLGTAGLLGGALIVGGMLVAQLGAGPRPAPPAESGGGLTEGPARAPRSGP